MQQVTAPAVALERHYSVCEIAKLWNLSEKTVRKMLDGQEGVVTWGSEEKVGKRGYRTMRVPESVLVRIHGRMRMSA